MARSTVTDYQGIVMEVYLGNYNNINNINRLSLNLFKHKLIDENKAFEYSVTKIFDQTVNKFRTFVNSPKSWKNRTYNLHDAYGCFLIFNDKKNSDLWFWKPRSQASITPFRPNYSLYRREGEDSYYRIIDISKRRRGVIGRFVNKKLSKPGRDPVLRQDIGIVRSTSKSARIGNMLYNKRERMNPAEKGKAQIDVLFSNYKPANSNGVTIVFANALYYSVFLEGKGKEVISNLVSTAEWLINTYGDKSKNAKYFIRKTHIKYNKTNRYIVNKNIVWNNQ